MLQGSLGRVRQGHRTIPYPAQEPLLPDRYRGLPTIDPSKCPKDCRQCAEACPTQAIAIDGQVIRLDLGRCLFCTDCTQACPEGAIRYTTDYRLATRTRADLILETHHSTPEPDHSLRLAQALDTQSRRLFGRSLKLRQVSAGGCNACEADLNVLNTVVFDLARFGIQFVASPRHADGIVVTVSVTENMLAAVLETYAAV